MKSEPTPASLFIEDYQLLKWANDNKITGSLICELTDEMLTCISELTTESTELDRKYNLSTNCGFDIKITKIISDDGCSYYTYDYI